MRRTNMGHLQHLWSCHVDYLQQKCRSAEAFGWREEQTSTWWESPPAWGHRPPQPGDSSRLYLRSLTSPYEPKESLIPQSLNKAYVLMTAWKQVYKKTTWWSYQQGQLTGAQPCRIGIIIRVNERMKHSTNHACLMLPQCAPCKLLCSILETANATCYTF